MVLTSVLFPSIDTSNGLVMMKASSSTMVKTIDLVLLPSSNTYGLPAGKVKTTLAKILSLLYEPSEGALSINDVDATLYDRNALRRKILLIRGDDLLFNDTLLFNLTFDREVELKEVIRYAKEIDLYDYIIDHTDRLGHIISENGKNLSTGQKRKIIILRALLSDAEVIIFDEVFRGLDVESQYKIEALLNGMKDRSMVFISHDPFKCLEIDRTVL